MLFYGTKGKLNQEKITTQTGRNLGSEPGRIITFSGPPVRTLKDMSPEEILKIEKQYGCKVKNRYQFGLR